MERAKIIFLIALEIPLLICLVFLMKSYIYHFRKVKILGNTGHDIKKEHTKLLLLFLAILLVVILGTVLPFLSRMALFITSMIVLATIFGFFYSFLGLIYGLGEAKGAGGSPAKVLSTLAIYLREYFHTNQPKEPPK